MVHISEMSGKLKHIPAINVNPLSNTFCQKMRKTDAVCKHCYSCAMLKTFRANCVEPFEKNSKLLSENVIVEYDLPELNVIYFRFNGHGELINDINFINYINICKKNPLTMFALWTKRNDIVKSVFSKIKKPKNLIMVFSNPKLNSVCVLPEYFDKVFNVTEDKNNPEINCKGRCWDCQKCYRKNKIVNIIELLKMKKKN